MAGGKPPNFVTEPDVGIGCFVVAGVPSVRAEDPKDLALFYGESDVLYCDEAPVALLTASSFDQITKHGR